MERYRGTVVELGDPLHDDRHVKLFITWLPEDKADVVVMCSEGNAVELGFAHYDGLGNMKFSDKEIAECFMKALSHSEGKKQRDDIVYFEEDEASLKYYFRKEDTVIVATDDDVYLLGSLSEAAEVAGEIGEEVAESVSRFVDMIASRS